MNKKMNMKKILYTVGLAFVFLIGDDGATDIEWGCEGRFRKAFFWCKSLEGRRIPDSIVLQTRTGYSH